AGLDPAQAVGWVVLELARMRQPRAQPAGEQVTLGSGARYANALDACDVRPERSEHRPPPARARPGDVGHDNAVEDLRQATVALRQVRPLGAVDDQAVDDVDPLLELGRAERRQSTPAQEG